ncbi:TPA: phage major capsid protein, P2 family [Yersinia enterocolitica]|uniref:Phage major capsid protein, P2 family n=2 Tax=Yersinia TaxID=629 RepID=A0A7U0ASE9_YEREN|nr:MULTISPECIES: phage major capsid protein, P2 family [Yersinia]OVZ97955.1 major capsid protein [Yersinia frederiksenii]EKN3575258.1 phage major capsid protein, P2 family [Yersinia enterocolitica]EKN4058321.1 phage major capsid protein, P2 family [Yersinia enterocolitica]EKN4156693.1 phage major capsid protein, P2 family [Yersinia enterocolitica]EKN4828911.1 phage major capsid protein, P2 family [Yersinia enterocolitica]
MLLNNKARGYLNNYLDGLALANDVKETSRYFSLTDPKETKLRDAMLESNEFLNFIVVEDVDQIKGQVVNVGNPGLFTGRVDEGRFRRKVGVDGNNYELYETDSGASLTYQMLSVWANAGSEEEFFQRMQAFTNKSFSLDVLRIGFNGKSAAKTTKPTDNPNGEDVNIGWHELVRTYDKNQIVTDAITLGSGGDFKSLDAMASDLINAKIPQEFRNDPRLVVLVGADLVAAEQYRLYQAADRPTEKIAAQMLSQSIAGRQAMVPPFFPGKRMTVTMLSNLHVYTQRGTRYRKAEFSDDRKQFENSYLRMEGYAVETPELYAAFDETAVTIGKVEEAKDGPEV